MASPPKSASAALQETEKAAVDGPSQHPENGSVRVETDKPQDGKTKKRAKKRSNAVKKRGTGFEEYFCDAPMTPAEYDEEQGSIYPPHRPFVDRIEECIQRFRARRRMGPERDVLFSRYLLLGGVDSTARQFQGTGNIGNDILEEASKGAVREMTADDVIQRGGDGNRSSRFYNPNYPDDWRVDFTGVAAGFLSEHLPKMVGSGLSDIRMGVDVVLNFLKYVDRHDVCPEYADDVKQAQKVCLAALEETPAIEALVGLLPGHFNTALRMLHGTDHKDEHLGFVYIEAIPDPKRSKLSVAVTLSTLMPHDERLHTPAEWHVIDTQELTFSVTAITPPSSAVRAKFQSINEHFSEETDIQPCGTLTARPILPRDGWDIMGTTVPRDFNDDTQFILEEDILRHLRKGMTLDLCVCTLNVGLRFIKYVKAVKPTYYEFLPQELMLNYKEPVANERPAKSVYDLEDEEGVDGVGGGEKDE